MKKEKEKEFEELKASTEKARKDAETRMMEEVSYPRSFNNTPASRCTKSRAWKGRD